MSTEKHTPEPTIEQVAHDLADYLDLIDELTRLICTPEKIEQALQDVKRRIRHNQNHPDPNP